VPAFSCCPSVGADAYRAGSRVHQCGNTQAGPGKAWGQIGNVESCGDTRGTDGGDGFAVDVAS